MNLKFSYSFYY